MPNAATGKSTAKFQQAHHVPLMMPEASQLHELRAPRAGLDPQGLIDCIPTSPAIISSRNRRPHTDRNRTSCRRHNHNRSRNHNHSHSRSYPNSHRRATANPYPRTVTGTGSSSRTDLDMGWESGTDTGPDLDTGWESGTDTGRSSRMDWSTRTDSSTDRSCPTGSSTSTGRRSGPGSATAWCASRATAWKRSSTCSSSQC